MTANPSEPAGEERSTWTWRETFLSVSGVALFAVLVLYLVWFGTAVAFQDDLTQVHAANPAQPFEFGWLWHQHNEHRVPLPRFVFLELLRLSRDFRTTTVLDLGLLAVAALTLALAARRARGGTRWTDAFFPLVLFSLAQQENLLNGFQVCFVLPVVLACVLVALFGAQRGPFGRGRTALVGILAVALLSCGSFGFVVAACAAAWLAWAAASSPGPDPRHGASRARFVATAFVVILCALGWKYLHGLDVEHRLQSSDPAAIARVTGQMLASWTGGLAPAAWPGSGLLAATLLTGGCGSALVLARRDRANRAAWIGILSILVALVLVALAIGRARGGASENPGFASRYATLSLVAPIALYVGACRLPGSAFARLLQVFLCLLGGASWIASIGPAVRAGRDRVQLALSLERAVHEGLPMSRIAATYGNVCFAERPGFERVLRELDRLGLPPFWRATIVDRLCLLGRDPGTGELKLPASTSGPRPTDLRAIDGAEGLGIPPGTQLVFPLPPRAFVVRGWFGVVLGMPDPPPRFTAHFVVEVRGADGVVLDSRASRVDADSARSHPGLFDFALPLEQRSGTTIVLRFEVEGDSGAENLQGFWGDVRLR